jgi:hypothetical protein
MSRVEYYKLSNVSANIVVAIFVVNLYWLVVFVNLIQGRQVGYEFDVMELSGGVEEVGLLSSRRC